MENKLHKISKWVEKLLNSISLMFLISLLIISAKSISAQGSAINLDGNNNPAAYNYNVDYISIPSDPALNLNGDFTIEMWFNMETTGGWANPAEQFYQPTWQTLISKGYWGNANEFGVLVSPNTFYVAINRQVYTAPANIQTNQWYHVALTRKNGLLQFYLNGNLLTGGSGTQINAANINNNKELRIGKNYGGPKFGYSDSHAYGFDGSIDEVRIWNVARSQTEIADNMNHSTLCNSTGLVTYFPMDENGENTVSSSVGNFVGTLVDGASWFVGVTGFPCIPTQTLTILGGFGNPGDIDPYTEASRDNGATWQPAYLTGGGHPWGHVVGTNSWVNFDPSFFVGLNSTTDYRIRFNIPAEFSNPKMTFTVKADNEAWISLNGTQLAYIVGQASNAPDLTIDQLLQPGMNEITIRLLDYGGWVGLNYRFDITMESNEAPSLSVSQFGALNNPPIANAGLDQKIDCSPIAGAEVTLDGSLSSDPDGDALSYSWSNGATGVSPTVTLAPGTHTLTLTVNDGGKTSTDDVTIIVNADTTAPVLTIPEAATLILGVNTHAVYSGPSATAVDVCDPSPVVTSNPELPVSFTEAGEFTIIYTATDANGNSATAEQQVTVIPTTLLEKSLTIPSLQSLIPVSKNVDKKISSAIKDIEQSIKADYWTDEYHLSSRKGEKVFEYEKEAVDQLLTFITEDDIKDDYDNWCKNGKGKNEKGEDRKGNNGKGDNKKEEDNKGGNNKGEDKNDNEHNGYNNKLINDTVKTAIADVILTLVDVDKTLAELAITEAQENYSGSKYSKKIDEAIKKMTDAQKMFDAGKYAQAIDKYKDAWKSVSELDNRSSHSVMVSGPQEISVQNEDFPETFNLEQNYPNPFNPTTSIQVAIPKAGYYTLKVYNTLGQEVAELVNGQMSGGYYKFNFDASYLSSGLYIYSIRGNNVNISKKMILMK